MFPPLELSHGWDVALLSATAVSGPPLSSVCVVCSTVTVERARGPPDMPPRNQDWTPGWWSNASSAFLVLSPLHQITGSGRAFPGSLSAHPLSPNSSCSFCPSVPPGRPPPCRPQFMLTSVQLLSICVSGVPSVQWDVSLSHTHWPCSILE